MVSAQDGVWAKVQTNLWDSAWPLWREELAESFCQGCEKTKQLGLLLRLSINKL